MFKKKTDFHLSTTDGVTNVLQGIFGEGRELDTPFSDLDQTFSMVQSVAKEIMGTSVDSNTPLMSAGLDSLAATGFAQSLSTESKLELPSTVLFDHPTLDSIASLLST